MADDRDISMKDVEREHLAQIHEGRHWAYVAGVLGGSFVLMLLLIAWLGASLS
jgi:uncharacterized membrane protein YdcZ (DUF606 family)